MKKTYSWDVSNSKFCLWDWNLETGSVGLSKNWIELLGYSLDEYLPNVQWFNSRLHPQDLEKVLSSLENHLVGLDSEDDFHFRLKNKTNHYVSFKSKGMIVIQDPSGKPGHVIWGSEWDSPIVERAN